MTPVRDFDEIVNLNVNQYDVDPFKQESFQQGEEVISVNATNSLTQSLAGLQLMSTQNIREKIMESDVADQV